MNCPCGEHATTICDGCAIAYCDRCFEEHLLPERVLREAGTKRRDLGRRLAASTYGETGEAAAP